MKSLLVVLFSLVLSTAAMAASMKYEIDASHSQVGFKVKHLVISNVKGKFDKFTATLEMDPAKPETLTGTGNVETASVNTDTAKRDEHLRSPDFFDSAKFPMMKLVVKKVKGFKGKKGKIEADLTIKDITKTVMMDYEFGGAAVDPWGNKKIAFSATGKINRKDFGLNWNKALETGGVVVGEEVQIDLEVEANQVVDKK